jgi:hypothetical protein
MESKKLCSQCYYFDLPSTNEPCKSCVGEYHHPNWRSNLSTVEEPTEDIGTSKSSPHYNKLAIQPIVVMFDTMTREEFLGYLKGNMIKYAMRAGLKDSVDKDKNKYDQYKYWHEELTFNPNISISDLL